MTAEQSHRTKLVLAIHIGTSACLCRNHGVLARGPITFDATGRFGVGPVTFLSCDVGSITIDLELNAVAIHLGEIK